MPLIDVPLEELTIALSEVMRRAEQSQAHLINFEELSTRERMSQILERMKTESFIEFTSYDSRLSKTRCRLLCNLCS